METTEDIKRKFKEAGIEDPTPHPAKFPDIVLGMMREEMRPHRGRLVLDPFAGIGRIMDLHPEFDVVGLEIELEWAAQREGVLCVDSIEWMRGTYGLTGGGGFSVIATSPSYGNRMADKLLVDGTRRHTYANALGRNLSDRNSGALQWGKAYRVFHEEAWEVAVSILDEGGMFLLNIKDHIRGGKHQYVTEWHVETLIHLGLTYSKHLRVPTRNMGHGQNYDVRRSEENTSELQSH